MDLFFLPQIHTQPVKVSQGSTYSELLSVIEEMSREIRPTYAGSKSAMERLKRGVFQMFMIFVWCVGGCCPCCVFVLRSP